MYDILGIHDDGEQKINVWSGFQSEFERKYNFWNLFLK